MDVVLAAVGRLKRSASLGPSIRDYERRIERYFRFRTIEVRESPLPDERTAIEREGDALLEAVPTELEIVALTRKGNQMSSRALARHLNELATYGRPGCVFLIGGAYGLSDRVLARASIRLSLSRMTLTHEMARLILVEQLYRAGTIMRGEPYHKGT